MASMTVLAQPAKRTPSPQFDSRRQSYISSAASYQTARDSLAPGSHYSHSLSGSSRVSSINTLGPHPMNHDSEPDVNPTHTAGHSANGVHAEEVHIVKVIDDRVHGLASDGFFNKVGNSLARSIPSSAQDLNQPRVGPPPPSPPASVERVDEDYADAPPLPPKMQLSKSEPVSRPVTFEESSGQDGKQSAPSAFAFSRPGISRAGSSPHEFRYRSSADTKVPLSPVVSSTSVSMPRALQLLHEPNGQSREAPFTEASGSQPSKMAYQSPDGRLQPPPLVIRPTRRNTTGSSPRVPATLHQAYDSQPFAYDDNEVGEELASDIQMQAEQIRRERNSKRAKAQQHEAAFTRSTSLSRAPEDQVLVGNLIGEDHVNYVLMYNMLTGIRIAVSRCQAKMSRALTDEDFKARHKFSFDIVGNELSQRPFYKKYSTGNELTPSAKYDFKFKDYAPWVFRELREEYFHLDPADYLLSLTAKYILSELGSPGKSGSFFYFSRDYRFIIKTIRHSEAKFLLSILKQYHAHVKGNPHTLISRFYGLHRVKLPHGRKIHFVIMNNLFPPHKDIHETYDLKGSTVGREYPEEKAAQKPRAVLKDLNWINRGRTLDLGPEKRALLTEQLRRDSELLKQVDVMDYSLLVGIHSMQRGNRDNVRSNTLKVFSPDMPPMRRKPTTIKGSKSPEAIAMRRAMRESDPKKLGDETIKLPEEDTGDRQSLIFYQDEGGLRATDEANEPMSTIYYLGVIDILTPYSIVKKLEHFWKGLSADRHKISPVEPEEYGNRFFCFMKAIMRGGGGGESFKPE